MEVMKKMGLITCHYRYFALRIMVVGCQPQGHPCRLNIRVKHPLDASRGTPPLRVQFCSC